MLDYHASDILAGIQEWAAIESPTHDVDGVNRMMDLVGHGYRQFGASVERIPGQDGCADHLMVGAPWNNGRQGILILSHMDTVHPVGTLERLPIDVDGDKAFGPGIYDMKGGAYLAFLAIRTLAEKNIGAPLSVRVLYTSDEEIGSPTSQSLIEEAAKSARYILVTEPARDGGKLVTARKGVARYAVTAHGRPAHAGSRHYEGRSAIREIARQILDLEALTDYESGLTCNVGRISGGTAVNVVPAECSITVDFRFPTSRAADKIVETMANLAAYDKDVRLAVNGGINRPPYEKTDDINAMFQHARGLASDIGFDLGETRTGGASDGNFTAGTVPTLDGLGVDGEGAHTLEEHLLISSLVPRYMLMRRLLETLDDGTP